MSTWLYQFWLFSFKTAKYWGQGPRDWFADILGFEPNIVKNFPMPSSHHSPADWAGRSLPGQDSNMTDVASLPSSLCRWSIHVSQPSYEGLPDLPPQKDGAMDPADPETYQQWPLEWGIPSYSEKLRNALESNDFSNIPADQLPAAIPEALQVAKRDPRDLAGESLGFAIMSRNREMVVESLESDCENVFHLATSYLDGSKACCDIINTISGQFPLRQHYTNDVGHTVLDNLMIAIVKSHSSCSPSQVDDAFKGQDRFAGEEVDICGRWDADSDCIRKLLAKGTHRIPFQWKHKFCHTSIQAICHSIVTLWGCYNAPDINTRSGLFVRRCLQPHCGLKMQMTPLHTLDLVMLQLSSHGCEGEDLFGTVAVLLCLLRYGANPLLQCALSITSLLRQNPSDNDDHEPMECEHNDLDPLQLANAIYSLKNREWTEKVRLGWRMYCEILRCSQQIWGQPKSQELPCSDSDSDDEKEDEEDRFDVCEICYHWMYLGKDGKLGLLWSAIKAELVTYRRLQLDHPWISDKINLQAMLESLQKNCAPDLPMIKDNMLNPTCSCGAFLKRWDDDCIGPETACVSYFSNMEDWSRTTFLELPIRDWWGEV
jgi:hypothetical protein